MNQEGFKDRGDGCWIVGPQTEWKMVFWNMVDGFQILIDEISGEDVEINFSGNLDLFLFGN